MHEQALYTFPLLLKICKLFTENNRLFSQISSIARVCNKGVVQRFAYHVIDLIRYQERNSVEKGYRHTCNGKFTTFASGLLEMYTLKITQLKGKQYI